MICIMYVHVCLLCHAAFCDQSSYLILDVHVYVSLYYSVHMCIIKFLANSELAMCSYSDYTEDIL